VTFATPNYYQSISHMIIPFYPMFMLPILYCYRYKVNTSTNSQEYSFSQFSVLRRYSDFVWLHDQLNFFHPGTIVPPLPEKQSVGRFTPEFVESRRRGIEKFMSRVTKHSILKETAVLASFLQADDAGFALCKEQYKQDRAAASGSMTNWLESKFTSLASGSASIEKTAADLKFDEVMQYIIQLETQMQGVSKHTSSLVKQNRAMANALFEFGQAFTWLGQSEGDGLGAALTQVIL
jgi:sorting nexin-1/2